MTGTAELVRDGLRLRARTGGPADGELVVLQHGRGGDASTWTGVAAHLADLGFRVLAPDLRGHGDSDWDPDARYTAAVLADDLAAWITSATSAPCLLVGHSYGAAVALATAARHQELVRGLLLEDGGPAGAMLIERWGRAADRPVPADRFATAADAEAGMELLWPGDTTPENRERRLGHFFRPDGAHGGLVWSSDMPGMARAPRDPLLLERSWELLDLVSCPLTVVVAGEGSMLDPDVGPRVRERVPAARVVHVPGAGHDVHTSRPAEFLRALDGFLASLPASLPAPASPEESR